MATNTRHVFSTGEVLTAANLNNNDENMDWLETEAIPKIAEMILLTNTTDLTVEDGVGGFYLTIPNHLDGWTLNRVSGSVVTASTSGVVTLQVHNVTDAVDMLSTALTIDQGETSSETAATAAVVNPTYETVGKGEQIRIDCDGAGTGTKGLTVILEFITE